MGEGEPARSFLTSLSSAQQGAEEGADGRGASPAESWFLAVMVELASQVRNQEVGEGTHVYWAPTHARHYAGQFICPLVLRI